MAINFPAAPSLNQTYTFGSNTWVWNGSAWDNTSTSFGPSGLQGTQGILGIQGTNGTAGSTTTVNSPITNSGTTTNPILGINATIVPYLASANVFTNTMTVNSTITTTSDMSVSGITVGIGSGAIVGNIAIGALALSANTSGGSNTASGHYSLSSNTTGAENTATGVRALISNTTGSYNVASSVYSLRYNTSGSYNVALGNRALYSNTDCSSLIAIGANALYNTTSILSSLGTITPGTGYTNGTYSGVALTRIAGTVPQTFPTVNITVAGGVVTSVTIVTGGTGIDITTVFSVASASVGGTGSGFSIPTIATQLPSNNLAIGDSSLYQNVTGQNNLAIGSGSMNRNTSGSYNLAIGVNALFVSPTYDNNIAIGNSALNSSSGGGSNIGIGVSTLTNNGGSNNIALGTSAGVGLTSGSSNLFLGHSAGSGESTTSNTLYISNTSTATPLLYGNFSSTTLVVNGNLFSTQPTVTAKTTTSSLLYADLKTRIVTATSATALTLTLDTGTNMDTGFSYVTHATTTSFDWSIINLGSAAGAVTMAGNTGHTIVGNTVVNISTSSLWRSARTGANTWVSYRLN